MKHQEPTDITPQSGAPEVERRERAERQHQWVYHHSSYPNDFRFKIGKLFPQNGAWYSRVVDVRTGEEPRISSGITPNGSASRRQALDFFHAFCENIIQKEQGAPRIKFSEASKKWADHLDDGLAGGARSASNVRINKDGLKILEAALGADTLMADITKGDIEKVRLSPGFLYRLDGKPRAPTSQENYLKTLKALFSYCLDHKLLKEVPKFSVEVDGTDEQGGIALEPDEARFLLRSVLAEGEDDLWLLLLIHLKCCIRTSLIYNLKWEQIDLNEKVFRMERKANKRKSGAFTFPINEELFEVLSKKGMGKNPGDYVIPRRNDSVQPPRPWHFLVRKFISRKSSTGRPFRLYDARHSYITMLSQTVVNGRGIRPVVLYSLSDWSKKGLGIQSRYDHHTQNEIIAHLNSLPKLL